MPMPKTKKKKKKKKGRLDMNDQQTLKELGVSTELMNFFYNGEIRRNRLRIEKIEREKAEVEGLQTAKERRMSEAKRRNKVYGLRNNEKLRECEIAISAHFIETMDEIKSQNEQNIVNWPATPLSY